MAKLDLANIILFKGLTKAELDFVAGFLVDKKYSENEIIFKKGDAREKIFIIDEGMVALEAEVDGSEIIAMFKSGDCLGEMALIDKDDIHQHDLKVISEGLTTLELSVHNWHTILKKKPEVSIKIYKNIATNLKNRLTHSNNKLVTLFATGKITGAYDNMDDVAEAILKIIQRVIPSDRALFMSYLTDTHKATVHKSIGYDNIEHHSHINISKDPVLSLLAKDPDTTIFQRSSWPKGSSDLVYKCERLIISPIHIKRKVFGFIILGDKSNQREFSINNQILLEAITTQVSPAIEEILFEKMKSAAREVKEVYIDPFSKY